MVTAGESWKRYCGTRGDLVRAIQRAEEVIGDDHGTSTDIDLAGGIGEKGPGTEPLDKLHRQELADVEALSVSVSNEPDRVYPGEEISIRINENVGMSLRVKAADRTRAEGIRSTMIQALAPSGSNFPPMPRYALGIIVAAVLANALLAAGPVVARAFGLAEHNDRFEAWEIVGAGLGVAIGIAIGWAVWWMFPTVELLDDGQPGRFRRFRGRFIAAVGAVILSVIGALVYDAVR